MTARHARLRHRPQERKGPAPRPAPRPLTAAQRRTVEDYLPLAYAIARPFWAGRPDRRDEIRGEAHWGLVQAVATYAPGRPGHDGRPVGFPRFARKRIRGAIIDHLRAGYRHRLARLNPFGPDVAGIAEGPPALEADDVVVRLSRRLPPLHGRFLRLMYRVGLNQGDTARLLGLSPSRGRLVHEAALCLLRSDLEENRERLIG